MFNYGYRHNKNLAKTMLDYNLLCINELNHALFLHKEWYLCGVLTISTYQKLKHSLSVELNSLYNARQILLNARHEARKIAYSRKLEALKVTQESKTKALNTALSKLSKEDREILKEFTYKL